MVKFTPFLSLFSWTSLFVAFNPQLFPARHQQNPPLHRLVHVRARQLARSFTILSRRWYACTSVYVYSYFFIYVYTFLLKWSRILFVFFPSRRQVFYYLLSRILWHVDVIYTFLCAPIADGRLSNGQGYIGKSTELLTFDFQFFCFKKLN